MARGGKRKGAGRRTGAKDKKPRGSPVIVAPAQERRELREAAREFTDDALKALVKICNGGQSESARVAAANALLDRGYGKPVQTIDSTVSSGEPFLADDLGWSLELLNQCVLRSDLGDYSSDVGAKVRKSRRL